ncbi:MAG: hypothetical protein NTU51_09385 [Bacteroidetes bacterium]|nr:hypothetical protein [Bacteroidota bacterium]
MKSSKILTLAMACMLMAMYACNTNPHPPSAMKLPGNENSARAYAKAENDYSHQWLDRFSKLSSTINEEIISRAYTFPYQQTVGNDSVLEAGETWSLIVRNHKEVHAVSIAKAEDHIIYTENDPAFNVGLRCSSSKDFIFIESKSAETSEVRLLPFSCKSLKPVLISERNQGIVYQAEHFGGGNLWILSNEKAPMRCIFIAPVASPAPSGWRAAVRENDSVFIDNYTVINLKYMVLVQRKHLSTSIEITNLYQDNNESGIVNKINFPEPEGQVSELAYDKNEDKLIFNYSSIITPPTCYTYGIHSMHMGIRWKKQVKNYVQDDYKAEIIWARDKYNKRIPVSIISKRDYERKENPCPVLLFVESGKPCAQDDNFNPMVLSLLNRGFYIARVHLSQDGSDPQSGREKVTAATAALIEKKITAAGLIAVIANGDEGLQAWDAVVEHSSWFRALLLGNPVFSPLPAMIPVPWMYVIADTNRPGKGFKTLTLVSSIRQNLKPGSTLLVSSGSTSGQNPEPGAKLITFILESFGIKK